MTDRVKEEPWTENGLTGQRFSDNASASEVRLFFLVVDGGGCVELAGDQLEVGVGGVGNGGVVREADEGH